MTTRAEHEMLTPEQWASLRDFADLAPEIMREWPRVKAASRRQGIVDWYNGVVARNPKLASALAAAAGAAVLAFTGWLTGLMPMPPAPEVVPVVVPVEKSEPPPAKMPAASKATMPTDDLAAALRAAAKSDSASVQQLVFARDVYADFVKAPWNAATGKDLMVSVATWERLWFVDNLPSVRAAVAKELSTLPMGALDEAARKQCAEKLAAIAAAVQALIGEMPVVKQAGGEQGVRHDEEQEQIDDDPPPEWIIYRKLPPGWADGPQRHSAFKALERKVR